MDNLDIATQRKKTKEEREEERNRRRKKKEGQEMEVGRERQGR